jgi:hypothetical protein
MGKVMTHASPTRPARLRVGPSDLLPILVTGVAGTLLILGADRLSDVVAAASPPEAGLSIAISAGLGFGLAVAIAGMQGGAEALTLRRAVIAWVKLVVVAGVVVLATGQFRDPHGMVRLSIILAASLGASLLLLSLRKRKA